MERKPWWVFTGFVTDGGGRIAVAGRLGQPATPAAQVSIGTGAIRPRPYPVKDSPMQDLLPQAQKLGALLTTRHQTVAVSESSAGGLVSAALLAVPGASAYYLGGAVVYTQEARSTLLGIDKAEMAGLRSSSEPYALLLARTMRARFGTSWGIAETGAAGPSGNRYGDAAGHSCVAISGPMEKVLTIETGSSDRVANMRAFAAALLSLLTEAVEAE